MTVKELKGYTWWPKDWRANEKIFKLNLAERGLYRELIDLAMASDNQAEVDTQLWVRLFGSPLPELERCLNTLIELGLVEIREHNFFIPSCEKRLQVSRAGRAGGLAKAKKKREMAGEKSSETPSDIATKQKQKQKQKQKEREKNTYRKFLHLTISLDEVDKLLEMGYSRKQVDKILDSIENYKQNTKYRSLYLTSRKWLEKEYGEPIQQETLAERSERLLRETQKKGA